MLLREEYEKREEELLAAYAVPSSKSLGREHKEEECKFRTAFQRDRDRIIHSEAFRRLEYKTQVFVNHEGDYYRTRLTHTLEVSQISRGVARTLRLNEDLAEAIALAHDLGHTPFGHSGEEAMNALMKEFGGFEHNRQSHRVVTLLEHRYPEFTGLNLTREVLEGIAKHAGQPTIEAQIVNIADEIAYLNHDLDDGLKSGLLKFNQLSEVSVWDKASREVKGLFPKADEKIWKYQIIRRLIHQFIADVQEEARRRISERKIESVADVRKNGRALVDFSTGLKPQVLGLKEFLYENLYRHPKVGKMADMARRIIEDLFKKYRSDPSLLPASFRKGGAAKKGPDPFLNDPLERHICDYIAGMTDRFALSEHKRLKPS